MGFIEAPVFTKILPAYLGDDEYRELQRLLANDPAAGDVMQGTGGFRKVRWADPRRRLGRRGGLRVIYFYFEHDRQIWLLTMYGKNEAADLSATERRALKAAVEEEKRHRAMSRGARRGWAMAKIKKLARKRNLFHEIRSGVDAMREYREGRLTLRTHRVEPISLPRLGPDIVRETREALHMSRQVFAFKLGVNPRTLERWEQGRSKPNEQATALIWLVRRYPDTLDRLESLSASA